MNSARTISLHEWHFSVMKGRREVMPARATSGDEASRGNPNAFKKWRERGVGL